MIRNSSIQEIAIVLPIIIAALTIHELCHGLMAYILGDSTAKRDGRLSLNPIRHIDPIGLLCIILVGFGWAKPVMVDPGNLKNPRLDMAFISIVGPLSNFLMAFLAIFLMFPMVHFVTNLPTFVLSAMVTFGRINIMLGVFNMLPIPPLDGSKVIAGLLPDSVYNNLPPVGRYGMIILLIAMMTGFTGRVISPIVQAIFSAFLSFSMDIFQSLFYMA